MGPELDDVEVALEDRPLVEPRLESPRQDRLLDLAIEAAALREERVLHELLADRRAAARELLVAQIDLEALADLRRVEAVMLVEPAVFGRYECRRHEAVELVQVGKVG